ncbi:hypothetical protein HLV35_01770 [Eggerthellaceae bacterium zg-997]|nr:hypothetical protein [Eggerthellaceae bacterium zg-997]
MTKDALIQIRVGKAEKEAADQFFASMSMTVADGVRIFIAHCLARQRFPFEIQPNVKQTADRAFGALHSYASPTKKSQERDAWIKSLNSEPDLLLGTSDFATNLGGDKAYRSEF